MSVLSMLLAYPFGPDQAELSQLHTQHDLGGDDPFSDTPVCDQITTRSVPRRSPSASEARRGRRTSGTPGSVRGQGNLCPGSSCSSLRTRLSAPGRAARVDRVRAAMGCGVSRSGGGGAMRDRGGSVGAGRGGRVPIRVAVGGVGNCAASLVQAVDAARVDPDLAGVTHPSIGGYRVADIEFVAAFDVDERKIGRDLSEAAFAEPNCTTRYVPTPRTGVTVEPGLLLDGVSERMRQIVQVAPICADVSPEHVEKVLRRANAEMV